MSLPALKANFSRVVCSPTGNVSIPSGTRQFSLQVRDAQSGLDDVLMLNSDPAEVLMLNTDSAEALALDVPNSRVKFANASDLANNYFTLEPGDVYNSPVGDIEPFTLYCQAPVSAVVELIYYTSPTQTVI